MQNAKVTRNCPGTLGTETKMVGNFTLNIIRRLYSSEDWWDTSTATWCFVKDSRPFALFSMILIWLGTLHPPYTRNHTSDKMTNSCDSQMPELHTHVQVTITVKMMSYNRMHLTFNLYPQQVWYPGVGKYLHGICTWDSEVCAWNDW